MAETDTLEQQTFPEELDDTMSEEKLTLVELLDELDEEGISESELNAIDDVIANYVGFSLTVKRGPQSKSWPEELKQTALDAVGGGSTGSVGMTDKLFPKGVKCVKSMGSALSEMSRLKSDLYYTLPHPRTGLRRVRIGMLEEFKNRLDAAEQKITGCAMEMNDAREKIKEAAEEELKGRYEEAFYDVDFTILYHVQMSFPAIGVPPALKQFEELRKQEAKRVQVESAQTLIMYKRVVAETFQSMVDAAAFRLEARQVLDNKHEVKYIDKTPNGNIVVYADASNAKGKKPQRTITLTDDELATRVETDERRKYWQDETMERLIGETERLQGMLNRVGVGQEDLTPIFGQLKKMLRGQTEGGISKQLKASDGFRESLEQGLVRISDSLLDTTVLRTKRDVIRGRSESRNINPNRG